MSHYETLGVPKDADQDEIKRAYRRESRKHHPDREGGDHDKMAAVNRAMTVLSDPEKRARYDAGEDEESTGDPIERRAKAAIMQVFVALMERANDYTDVIEAVRAQLRRDRNSIPGLVEQGKQRITKLEKKARRLKYRGTDPRNNFIAAGVKSQIAAIQDGIKTLEQNVKVADLALELLEDFGWATDDPATFTVNNPHTAIELFASILAERFGLSPDLLDPKSEPTGG